MMKWLVWVVVALIAATGVFAQSGTIRLLALTERDDGGSAGTLADLDLKIEKGSGKVFLETFPLTKITTQISMRFAQQIACKELEVDCSDKDFFFTIHALPGIVGGPSAGSAAGVLAASLLTGAQLRNDTAITGTINSGGIIGPVGGLKEKIQAASDAGIARVLIPRGTRILKENTTNASFDLVAFGKEKNVEVVEVATLQDALYEYTGRNFSKPVLELGIEPRYSSLMHEIALDLCNRTGKLKEIVERRRSAKSNTTDIERGAEELIARANNALRQEKFYAAASYCFRSNVLEKRALAGQRNWSEQEILSLALKLRGIAVNVSQSLKSRPVRTITDLQTSMAVMERLLEVEETLIDISEALNETRENADRLAYAEERLYSAVAWSRFFNGNDKELVVDAASLRDSCSAKLAEAEERFNYVRSLIPGSLKDTRRFLDTAYADANTGNYALCLFKASKSKAEADVILGLMGVDEARVDELIDLKLGLVRNALAVSQRKGVFPIIGYSYYEYSGSLKDFDKYSSLLFAEYALELSNLDLYFPKRRSILAVGVRFAEHPVLWLLAGIVIGAGFAMLALRRHSRTRKRR